MLSHTCITLGSSHSDVNLGNHSPPSSFSGVKIIPRPLRRRMLQPLFSLFGIGSYMIHHDVINLANASNDRASEVPQPSVVCVDVGK